MRSHFVSAITFIAFAGTLLFPAQGKVSGSESGSNASSVTVVSSNKTADNKSAGDKKPGPWDASCSYWAAAREVTSRTSTSEQPLPAADDHKSACAAPDNRWGIPDKLPKDVHLDVSMVLATVPNPVRSHLAMEFDRVIDAYTLAASDANYSTSYHWLPWKVPSATASSAAGNADDSSSTEALPGLVLMKYVTRQVITDARPEARLAEVDANYFHVMYVFLIAESPASGIDGTELVRAIGYQRELFDLVYCRDSHAGQRERCRDGNKFRVHTGADDFYVVGPIYSGSAASLRTGLETGLASSSQTAPGRLPQVRITGATSTGLAINLLNEPLRGARPLVNENQYISYGEPGPEELRRFPQMVRDTMLDRYPGRVAVFAEEGTAYGSQVRSEYAARASGGKKRQGTPHDDPLVFLFARDISVLRNHADTSNATSTASGSASPYLQLSLKDTDADDSVVHFGGDSSAVSQEAQLIAITRQLERARTRYVIIQASNPLDVMYLARFVERACPDARLVFFNGDLLMQHGGDNGPYVGSINLSPYGLIDPSPGKDGAVLQTIPSSREESVYKAAAFAFRGASGLREEEGIGPCDLTLRQGDYRTLWATAAGHDGYYPLGLIAQDQQTHSPGKAKVALSPCERNTLASRALEQMSSGKEISPSILWYAFVVLAVAMCAVYLAALHSRQFWSEFVGDFVLEKGDQPRRRAVCIGIGGVMVWCMTVVLSIPVFAQRHYLPMPWRTDITAGMCLLAGFALLVSTLVRTWPYFYAGMSLKSAAAETRTIYTICNAIAALTAVFVPVVWSFACFSNYVSGELRFTGLFFSYRSLYPGSGVSPVLPVFLLLLAWLMWSLFQLFRLRFSPNARPLMPESVGDTDAYPLYVSDAAVKPAEDRSSLEERMTCLLITRHIFGSVTKQYPAREAILIGSYFVLFGLAVIVFGVQSVERFLLNFKTVPTPFEVLIASLLFPLLMIALAGFLRILLVWASLRQTVLSALERLPLRFAFTRLHGMSWKAMLSTSGYQDRLRDMARSTEAIRQLRNSTDIRNDLAQDPAASQKAEEAWLALNRHIGDLRHLVNGGNPKNIGPVREFSRKDDLPVQPSELALMRSIELDYAACAEAILAGVLLPYWRSKRAEFIEPDEGKDAAAASATPKDIQLAEEFLAYRYVSLIRAVLVNLRYLMVLVLAIFVLAIVAWNSYPFQPRAEVDWIFTALLTLLIGGIVLVLAQMHRNAILSRITNTKPNELGAAFFAKFVGLAGVPVLTWLLYHFPDTASTVTRWLQPGMSAMK